MGYHGCRNYGCPLVPDSQGYQRLSFFLSLELVGSFACYACWQDFYLPCFCLPNSFSWFSFIFTPNFSDRKQWIRICYVVAVHFVLPWYDPSWLSRHASVYFSYFSNNQIISRGLIIPRTRMTFCPVCFELHPWKRPMLVIFYTTLMSVVYYLQIYYWLHFCVHKRKWSSWLYLCFIVMDRFVRRNVYGNIIIIVIIIITITIITIIITIIQLIYVHPFRNEGCCRHNNDTDGVLMITWLQIMFCDDLYRYFYFICGVPNVMILVCMVHNVCIVVSSCFYQFVYICSSMSFKVLMVIFCLVQHEHFLNGCSVHPPKGGRQIWCLPPVWNLRAVSLIPLFYISCLVLLLSLYLSYPSMLLAHSPGLFSHKHPFSER